MKTSKTVDDKNKAPGASAAGQRARTKASSRDVLGASPKPVRLNPQWADHHRRLCLLKIQLLEDKRALSKDTKTEVASSGEHHADAASDAYDRDLAFAMLSSEQNVLLEIELALNRIARGTYGICELNGGPIEPERLLAIPWTRFATSSQRELESGGNMDRTQMEQAGTLTQSSDAAEEAGEENE